MDQTTHRLPPGFVWPTLGHPGSVPLWALVPTPNQPRLSFNVLELNALADTMSSEGGSEQLEILTIRELTKEELVRYAPARYMIKSGERRWRAAKIAGLEMLEVRVKRWSSIAKEKLDTWMFNENRVNLTFYENARYLADLIKEWGWETQAQVVKGTGKDAMWVSDHMAFSKLHPAVQEQMRPDLPEADRYKRETAVFFARFDKDIQLDLHNNMPVKCRTVPSQIGWMNQYLISKGIEVPMRGREPRMIRRLIASYADYTERKALAFLAAEDFDRLFENAGQEQIGELLGKLGDTEYQFNELLKKVRGLAGINELPVPKAKAKGIKKPSEDRDAAFKAAQQRIDQKKKQQPAVKPTVPIRFEEPVEKEEDEMPAPVVKKRPVAVAPFPPRSAFKPVNHGGEKTVQAEDSNGRIGLTKVNARQYVELWNAKRLDFQIKKKPKPDHYPTLEQAQRGEGFD